MFNFPSAPIVFFLFFELNFSTFELFVVLKFERELDGGKNLLVTIEMKFMTRFKLAAIKLNCLEIFHIYVER